MKSLPEAQMQICGTAGKDGAIWTQPKDRQKTPEQDRLHSFSVGLN